MPDYKDIHLDIFLNITIVQTTLSPFLIKNTTPHVDPVIDHHLVEIVFEGVVLIIICLIAIVGNMSMWIIVCRCKDLRTVTNSFILTLATADLMVSIINMPITVVTIFARGWILSDFACKFVGFTNMLTLVYSVLSLCNISINRYIMICRPTKFKNIYTKKKAALMIFATTSAAILLSLPPLFGWSEYSFTPVQSICFSNWAKSLSYAVFMISCCFGVPLFSMLICNILIIRKVKKRNTRVSRMRTMQFHSVVKLISQKTTRNLNGTRAPETNCGSFGIFCSNLSTGSQQNHGINDDKVESSASYLPKLAATKEKRNTNPSYMATTSENIDIGKSSGQTLKPVHMERNISQDNTLTDIGYESESEVSSVQIELKSSKFEIENNTEIETVTSNVITNKKRTTIQNVWSKANQENVHASSNEVRMARVLSVVVALFALCWAPYCISMLLTIFCPDKAPRAFHMATLLIGYFNSSCNPVLYGVLNKRFGKEFKRLYCCW